MKEMKLQDKILRSLTNTYLSIQQEKIRTENRLRAILQEGEDKERLTFLKETLTDLKNLENHLYKRIKNRLDNNIIYKEFLSKICGIGYGLSARLLSLPLKLNVNLSSWNAYFGLTPAYALCKCVKGHKFMYPKVIDKCPLCKDKVTVMDYFLKAPKRKQGYKPFWNIEARTLAYLISRGFVIAGKFYKEQYKIFKARYSQNNSITKKHIDSRARRTTFKLFLAHFYQASHELLGLKARIPYQFEYLKHKDFIHWKEVIEYEQNNNQLFSSNTG